METLLVAPVNICMAANSLSEWTLNYTNLYTLQCRPVPNLDCVISQSRYNLVIVVLKTIDTLGVLRTAINSLKNMSTHSPVLL